MLTCSRACTPSLAPPDDKRSSAMAVDVFFSVCTFTWRTHAHAMTKSSENMEKKIFSRNARHASGGSTGHLKSIAYRSLPPSLPIFFPPPSPYSGRL
eukprot:scaffold5391_cov121-Isochrysis_galbana.AAC.1